ncbi:MAG: AMP-binding protein [Burkholderiaceae bacterium]|nr:AMP-binding protein [Burkholderiaceae bacterium]
MPKLEMILPPERIAFAKAGGFWPDQILLDYFDRNTQRHPERLAVTGYNSMKACQCQLTTGELDRHSRSIAAALLQRGIEPGDVVSAQLPNWWEMIALHLAALRVGAVFNPLMPMFRERELKFMLNLAQSKLIVAPERFRDFEHGRMLQALRPELPHLQHIVVIGAGGPNSFEDMLTQSPGDLDAEFARRRPGADEVIEVLYTSGTTGEPKGVMHTSNTLMSNMRQQARIQGFNENDVTLMSSPLAHQTGFLYGIMMPIMTAGRVVLQDFWKPSEAVDLIEREGVTFSMGSTPFLADLLEAAQGRREALRTLNVFIAAGAPIPRLLVRRAADDFGVKVCSMWGMSENGPAAFTRPDDPPSRTLETDGCAAPGTELRVVDDAGVPVASGAEGRLMVRGAGMFVGYLLRPELYATDKDGWFDTGDLARMDDAGYLRITGRSKDVIIRGGENIPVIEIENLLYQHPAVAEVAIVAMPDPRLNERACAFVVLRPGQSLTMEEMSRHLLAQKCAKAYLPERLEVLDAMPRNATGKIQKFVLRDRARELTQR